MLVVPFNCCCQNQRKRGRWQEAYYQVAVVGRTLGHYRIEALIAEEGGTPRAEGVFPPVFPLLFPSDRDSCDPTVCVALIHAVNRTRYQTAIRIAFLPTI
jgi:hypothetical protein